MKTLRRVLGVIGLGVGVGCLCLGDVTAQVFNSGSTGADGAFAPPTTVPPGTVVNGSEVTVPLPPDGLFNFTTVTVPSGVTVRFQGNTANTPVTLLATGDVIISGTMDVSGDNGAPSSPGGPIVNPGALGGPGGFAGGPGGARGGGSAPGQGLGLDGGIPASDVFRIGGRYGAPAAFVSLLPLFGGSGGAGSAASTDPFGSPVSGSSGGGGGGAIVVASSTKIVVGGSVDASGGSSIGNFGQTQICSVGASFNAGGGSGGALRLVAPEIVGAGALRAQAGVNCQKNVAGDGRIRLESLTFGFTGTATPAVSFSSVLNPVTPSSTPALVNLPTITVTSVGGTAAPTTPGGTFATPDVLLPGGTTNPVPVSFLAQHVPVGTIITVRLTRQLAEATSFLSTPLAGTFESSTATADVDFPAGEVSLFFASATFTLPQFASLLPAVDGDPAERVLVAAAYGHPSIVTLITRSGKQLRADTLPPADQLKLAKAFAVARKTGP